MKPTSISLDIETLGTRPGSVILSIGAVPFSRDGVLEQEGIHLVLPVDEQLAAGATIDPSTLLWWLDRGAAGDLANLLRASADSPDLLNCLIRLRQYLAQWEARHIWANSPSFDLVLLENLMHRVGFQIPWNYYDHRDVRTLLASYGRSRCSEVLPAPKGAHDALVDAIYQAKVICEVVRGGR